MPGFTERERVLVAALCRYHRKALPNPMHAAFQPLTPEEKRALTFLIPLLRLADNMVRGPERRIESLTCREQNGEVTLLVHSSGDIDLEQWGAERAASAFQQVFNRTLTLVRAR
jgi:exopolyphosphatase/guanosine-5'-triphosphate,3'-diphosphate pyrophosphatase